MGKVARTKTLENISSKKKPLLKNGIRRSREKHDGKTGKRNPISNERLSESLLESLKLKLNNAKTHTPGDVIKANKIVKSRSVNKIKKKDKLNTKKKLLLKKINLVNEMKKKLEIRDKRKSTVLMGDTNPLHDALPSLEPLFKLKRVPCIKPEKTNKKKGVEKAGKRKKQVIKDVEVFKRALRDKTFKANPFDAISNHVQSVVQFERNKKVPEK